MTQTGEEQLQQPEANMELCPHWRGLFNKYDINKDGRISLSELQRMLQSESYSKDIPKYTVRKILKKADEDKNGYLEYEEFVNMTQHQEVKELLQHTLNRYIIATVVQHKTRSRRGNYEKEYSCSPPPYLMIVVSLLEITAFVVDIVNKAPASPIERSNVLGPVGIIFVYNPLKRYEVWRYITYMFVHFSVFHIVFNLLVQITLGIPLEMVHGWWRVLTVYLAGVLAGSLGTSISDPAVFLGGASGGVYALLAAHLSTICMNWAEMGNGYWQLMIFLPFMALDTGIAIYMRTVKGSECQDGYPAHLAGALAGLLVGINVLKNLEVESWENKVWWISAAIYTVLMLITIIWNIAYPSYFYY